MKLIFANGGFYLHVSLHKFLLERIAKQLKPIFLGSELACYQEAEVSLWLNAGVLKRADVPRKLRKVCEDGIERELQVFKHDDTFFGRCIDNEELLPAVELTEVELLQYRLSRKGLAHAIALENQLNSIAFEDTELLAYIGESSGYIVFLLHPAPSFEQLWPKLNLLADQLDKQPALIVVPVAVHIPYSYQKQMASLNVKFASLGVNPKRPFKVDFQTVALSEEKLDSEQYLMRHTGSSWTINFLGYEFSVKDNLGTRYIAHLLAHPSTVFDVSQLKNFMSSKELDQDNTNDSTTEAEGSIEVSTKENLIRLKSRQRELESERQHETNQVIIAEIDEELETINAEFKRILSRSGQIRRESGTSNKDRKSVSNAVRRGIYKQVESRCPACKKYFENRIDLGFQCMFVPAKGEVWKIRFSQKSSMLHKM